MSPSFNGDIASSFSAFGFSRQNDEDESEGGRSEEGELQDEGDQVSESEEANHSPERERTVSSDRHLYALSPLLPLRVFELLRINDRSIRLTKLELDIAVTMSELEIVFLG